MVFAIGQSFLVRLTGIVSTQQKSPSRRFGWGFSAIQLWSALLSRFDATESLGGSRCRNGLTLAVLDPTVVAVLEGASLEVFDQITGIDLVQGPKMQVVPTHLGRVIISGDHLMLQDIPNEVGDSLGIIDQIGVLVVGLGNQDLDEEPEHRFGDGLVSRQVVFLGHGSNFLFSC